MINIKWEFLLKNYKKKLSIVLVYPEAIQKKKHQREKASIKEIVVKEKKYLAVLRAFSRTFPPSVGAKIMCCVENSSTS